MVPSETRKRSVRILAATTLEQSMALVSPFSRN